MVGSSTFNFFQVLIRDCHGHVFKYEAQYLPDKNAAPQVGHNCHLNMPIGGTHSDHGPIHG
jgi:hypothetical protein